MSIAIVNEGWRRPLRLSKRVMLPIMTGTAEDRAFARAFQTLTPRRQQILRLLAEGYTGQEVAAQLAISHITVKNTLTATYAQLGLSKGQKSNRACYLLGRYDQRLTGAELAAEEA